MSAVRNAREVGSADALGTVLWLDPIRLSKDLWTDFNFVQFNDPNFGIGVRNQVKIVQFIYILLQFDD